MAKQVQIEVTQLDGGWLVEAVQLGHHGEGATMAEAFTAIRDALSVDYDSYEFVSI